MAATNRTNRPKLTAGHAGTAVLAAVLVAVIGVGSWAAWGHDLPVEYATGKPPIGEAGRLPSDPLTIAELGGAKENFATIRSMRGVMALDMLTHDELAALTEYGAGRARVGVAKFAEGKATVLLVQMPNSTAARYALDKLVALQRGYGFEPDQRAPDGVEAGIVGGTVQATPGGRAHYVHDTILVRVEFRGPEAEPARERFFEVLDAQAAVVSPHA